jgi:hypothetical protein
MVRNESLVSRFARTPIHTLGLILVGQWLASCGDDARSEPMQTVAECHDMAPVDAGGTAGEPTMDSQASGTSHDPSDLAYTFPCLGLGETEPTHEATFTSVYLDVFCPAGCTNPFCHGSSGAWGGLDLSSSIEVAYANLVEQRTGTTCPADGRPTCRDSELLRVAPGSPEQSLLYLKISGAAPCGMHMPPPESNLPPLASAELEQIRRWIEAGAPLDSAPVDAGEPSLDGG